MRVTPILAALLLSGRDEGLSKLLILAVILFLIHSINKGRRRSKVVLVACLLTSIACAGSRAERFYQEGRALGQAGRHRAAIEPISKAVRLAPDVAKYHLGLGVALANAGIPKQAEAEIQEALRIDPAYLDARKALYAVQQTLSYEQTDLLVDELRNR